MTRPKAYLLDEVIMNQILKRRGKRAFFSSLPPGANVLDVGCGATSPRFFERLRPDCHYVGLDVQDQWNHSRGPMQEFILTTPERFASTIQGLEGKFDAVVSSHNIEHCGAPDEVLNAMLNCVRPGGKIYIAFPCEESVSFPNRVGTLNFFDDSTHCKVPNWGSIVSTLKREGFVVEFIAKRYRPILLATMGLLLEPVSALARRVAPGCTTWSLYGFESIIWASRPMYLPPRNADAF